jgi:hypothetical protein
MFDQTRFHPDHLSDLRNSGLSDDTIEQSGVYSVRPSDINTITKVPGVTSLLAIPYASGEGFTRYRVFPANLKTKAKKGSLRYLQPKGSGVHLYIPRSAIPACVDTDAPLGIVEGEKKALKACQEGVMCLAIGGLWNWLEAGRLIPDLKSIPWKGRRVTLYPDSDVWKPSRGDLREAVYRLGCALEAEGAAVSVCVLPGGAGETKAGLDDYLMQHGAEPLRDETSLALTDRIFDHNREKAQARKPSASAQEEPELIRLGARVVSCQHNALAWLAVHGYTAKVRLDTFRQCVMVDGDPLTDELAIEFVRQMEDSWKIRWVEAHVRSALISLGSRQPYSSLTTWLDSLVWDRQKRLQTFFAEHYGSEVSEYTEACADVLFLSAVARAYRPGCQADVTVTLIGSQGIGKSRGIAELVPDHAWYTDDLGGDLYQGKVGEGLQGKWLIEFGEFARINRATIDVAKAFLSRRVDHYRPAYGRVPKDFPRQCIFVGTTNNPLPFSDLENRRFMPVHCPKELTDIASQRDQLWAEAVHRYKAGEAWWITDKELLTEVKARQEDARMRDAWEELLRDQLLGVQSITFPEVADRLRIPAERQDKGVQTRLGLAMKANGFIRKRERNMGELRYVWVREA